MDILSQSLLSRARLVLRQPANNQTIFTLHRWRKRQRPHPKRACLLLSGITRGRWWSIVGSHMGPLVTGRCRVLSSFGNCFIQRSLPRANNLCPLLKKWIHGRGTVLLTTSPRSLSRFTHYERIMGFIHCHGKVLTSWSS